MKRAILLCLIFALLIISLNSKKTEAIQWWTSFNYKDLDEMKEAGWAITRPAGIRLVSAGVILDGVRGASAIGIYNEIPRGIFDWKVDDSLRMRSLCWLLARICPEAEVVLVGGFLFCCLNDALGQKIYNVNHFWLSSPKLNSCEDNAFSTENTCFNTENAYYGTL